MELRIHRTLRPLMGPFLTAAFLIFMTGQALAVVNVDVTVRDGGDAVANATIIIEDDSGEVTSTFTTDGNGRVTLALPDCSHRVKVKYGFLGLLSKTASIPCGDGSGGGSADNAEGVMVATDNAGHVSVSIDVAVTSSGVATPAEDPAAAAAAGQDE